jgi:hypothetical protein
VAQQADEDASGDPDRIHFVVSCSASFDGAEEPDSLHVVRVDYSVPRSATIRALNVSIQVPEGLLLSPDSGHVPSTVPAVSDASPPRWTIEVPGEVEKHGNAVIVNGRRPHVRDADFRFFLRLVIARYDRVDGFVDRGSSQRGGGLAAEGIYSEDSMEPATGRLRTALKGYFDELTGLEIIEVSRRQVRLCAAREQITVAWGRLLEHPDGNIRSLAQRGLEAQARSSLPAPG